MTRETPWMDETHVWTTEKKPPRGGPRGGVIHNLDDNDMRNALCGASIGGETWMLTNADATCPGCLWRRAGSDREGEPG